VKLKLEKLIEILAGVPDGAVDPSLVVDTALINFDSRKVVEGGVFIAFATEKQDGAKYINDAMNRGAILAIAGRNPDNVQPVILVKDAVKALQDLGRYVRSQYKGFVIGITGSSGKTTSKELVAHMLADFDKTFYGEGSFNNHIGTPYNLCRLDFDAPCAVFELGMDHAGEISALVDMVRPHLAAVTNIFPMHMEFFKEFRDIAYAKAEIFEKLVPYNNHTVALINADANFAEDVLIPQAKKRGINEIITFGKKGQVKLKSFSINKACKTDVVIEIGGKTYHHADLGLGERFAYNANFAAAVAFAMGLDVGKAVRALADFSPLKGRGKISTIPLDKGFDITLIDDSYNGQPEAMRYAIATLNDIPKKGARKIAVIGKMAELGTAAEAEHRLIGKALAASDIDIVIGVGPETKFMLDEISDAKTKIFKENIGGLFDELTSSILQPDDILLIKGAHYSSKVFEVADKLLGLGGTSKACLTN
jgi:UDP-N-acetylmuramoyl-tripeptide--D-alanyl-D-alanine ligase